MQPTAFVSPDTVTGLADANANPRNTSASFYFGASNTPSLDPQAFLVNYEPRRVARAHFHHVDQFQIFFGAPDTLFQRHNTGPLLVHYTDGDTFYGPFSAGEQAFQYMTLRRHGSDFHGVLPENKDELSKDGRKRQYHFDLRNLLEDPLPKDDECTISTFLEREADGVAGVTVLAGPGALINAPSPQGSGGQYYVVVDGDVEFDQTNYSKRTIGWVDADDAAPTLIAGLNGARLLVLQFAGEAA